MNFLNIHLYQVVITLVSAYIIFQGIKNYVSGKSGQTIYKVLIRVIIWGGMATIAIFPKITNLLAKVIGLEGNINAVILAGFLLIFLIIFKLLSAIEKLEQNMSEITRKDSLKQLNEKSDDGK